jgi:hypothetical protein
MGETNPPNVPITGREATPSDLPVLTCMFQPTRPAAGAALPKEPLPPAVEVQVCPLLAP